jgi:hypothetical protein
VKKAGVGGHRLYDLRHTFASALLAKCTPITSLIERQFGAIKWRLQSGAREVSRDRVTSV